MSLDPRAVHEVQSRALGDWLRWIGSASAGSRTLELPGVIASVVPAVPDRSIVNGVSYGSATELDAALDGLASAYAEAGVRAWTVWTPEWDADAIELLTARGHSFDGQPLAMALELAELRAPEPGELDWDPDGDPVTQGELNDLAYGWGAGGGIAAAFGHPPAGLPVRFYRARVAGTLACVLATMDHADDTGVYFVATHPAQRGRGLASRLLGAALREARGRGQRTASLQSSAMGEPVYRRLGFREAYRLHMYERRG